MFGPKAARGRGPRVLPGQLDTGNDAATGADKVEGHRNERGSLHLQQRIKKFALFSALRNFILKKRLLTGEHHADQAGLQRLPESPDELIRLRTGVDRRHKEFRGIIDQPDCAFMRAGLRHAVAEDVEQQGIDQRGELLRSQPGRYPGKSLGQFRLQFNKRRLGQDVQARGQD